MMSEHRQNMNIVQTTRKIRSLKPFLMLAVVPLLIAFQVLV